MSMIYNGKTILIVDDEEQIVSFVTKYLQNEGYQVMSASTGSEALEILSKNPEMDLVLLDWMMPGMSGLDVCRELRKYSAVPVIFLTAKSDELNKLLGLEMGADDYISKPFSIRELEVRIRTVLRRVQSVPPSAGSVPSPVVSADEMIVRSSLVINITAHTVSVAGTLLTFTPTEFNLLLTLAKHPGRVFGRTDLLEIALGDEYAGYERTIDTHIRNIRKKMEAASGTYPQIVTVHGIGYKLEELS